MKKKRIVFIPQLIRTFGREFAFVFRMAPKHATILTILQFLIGVIPAIELFLGARIVDELIQLQGTAFWSPHLSFYVIVALTLLGIQRLVFSFNDYIVNYLRSYLQLAVNNRIHDAVLRLDLPTLERSHVHTLITYLKDQSWRPQQMTYVVFQMLGNLAASFSYVGISLTFSPFYTFLFLLAVLPSLVVSVWAIHHGQKIAFGKASLWKQVWYFENLFRLRRSLVELMVHQVGAYFASRYRRVYEEVISKEMAIEARRLFGALIANIGAFGVYILVYVKVVQHALNGFLSIGQFTLYIGAFINIERFLVTQAWEVATLIEHTKYLDTFRELESLRPKVRDRVGATILEEVKKIEFVKVSYRYPNTKELALNGISFLIRAGERVAVVGENGAGKSTLMKLLMRLYEPTKGKIFINGHDYRTYTLASLRKQIGITFQDFMEYSLTTRENIGLGELTLMDDQSAIESAAKRAGIHERIERLPKKYETILGHEVHEEGVELSGGEWQKLALARSLIKSASVLILDEPTAALDARSEYHFFTELFSKTKKQTVIVISHRFSSVRVADRIFVLKDGKLAEQGTHTELNQKNGLYAELYHLQTKDF